MDDPTFTQIGLISIKIIGIGRFGRRLRWATHFLSRSGTSRWAGRSHRDKTQLWRLDDGTRIPSLDDRHSAADHFGDLAVRRPELT
jgi:hypothetical protein